MEMEQIPNYLNYVKDKITFIKKGSGNEYIFRCPYCGDSQRNKRKGRFYLNIESHFWNCFNCGEKGHINKLLEDMNLSDFKVTIKNDKRKLNIKLNKENLIIPNITDFDISKYNSKIKYFKQRTHCKDEQILKLPMVINYKDFIELNESKITKNKDIIFNNINYFDKNYLGFYSSNKYIVSFRNTDLSSKYRYDIYKMQNSSEDFIIISDKNINMLKTIYHRPLKVLIAEGIFDILIPYLNNLFIEEDIDLFVCSMGATKISSSIHHIVSEFCNTLDVIYCIDNDQLRNFKRNVYERVKYFCNNFKVYRNTLHKDMGEFPILKEKYIEINTA